METAMMDPMMDNVMMDPALMDASMYMSLPPMRNLPPMAYASSPGMGDRSSCMFSSSPSSVSSCSSSPSSSSPPMKENSQRPGASHCKRRLDFSHSTFSPMARPHPVAVSRRNERERNRVKLINMTFATLREHLPTGQRPSGKSKKLSKVDTLRAAIDYIRQLQGLVEEKGLKGAEASSTPLGVDRSPSASLGTPSSSPASQTSLETLSPEEEDLLDFVGWF